MCCKNFWKRIIPFAIALAIGLLAANILQKKEVINETPKEVKPIEKILVRDEGRGFCHAVSDENTYPNYKAKYPYLNNSSKSKGLEITSKPMANYTESARLNNAQGAVTLRVTFLANGTIGDVSPITELPYGLTEQCILAAKKIKFKPSIKNGRAKSVTKVVEYRFTIY